MLRSISTTRKCSLSDHLKPYTPQAFSVCEKILYKLVCGPRPFFLTKFTSIYKHGKDFERNLKGVSNP